MIDVWLKIKIRRSRHLVLKHLNHWLATFSDPSKYRITIYNEDFPDLSKEYHNAYRVINRALILANPLCAQLNRRIETSRVSECWRKAASALSFPYFVLPNSEWIIGVDADDFYCPGWSDNYTDQVITAMTTNNLPVMSYDYIFSHNPFNPAQPRNFLPHHWSFGLTFANTTKMRQEILEPIFSNMNRICNYIPQCNFQWELNLDVLVSTFLQRERLQDKYWAFITSEGAFHGGFPHTADSSMSKLMDGMFHWNFEGNDIHKPLHSKTLVLI